MRNLSISLLGLVLTTSIVHADTIVQNTGIQGFPGTFNYVGYNSSNVAFGQPVASEFLSLIQMYRRLGQGRQ
jgi:hypothetical protein